jgi:DNA-binding IclR family transcriptional regulator
MSYYEADEMALMEVLEEESGWQGRTAALAEMIGLPVPTLLVVCERLARQDVLRYTTAHKHSHIHIDVLEGN